MDVRQCCGGVRVIFWGVERCLGDEVSCLGDVWMMSDTFFEHDVHRRINRAAPRVVFSIELDCVGICCGYRALVWAMLEGRSRRKSRKNTAPTSSALPSAYLNPAVV